MSDQELSDARVDELVALALSVDRDSDQYRRILTELRARGGESTYETAIRLLLKEPFALDERGKREIILGIHIRDQLGEDLSKTPAGELVAMALRLDRGSRVGGWYWRVVGELRTRDDQQSTFETASTLIIDGPGDRERILGIDILAHLGSEEGSVAAPPFLEQSLPLVEGCIGFGHSAQMITAAVQALGNLGDKRSLPLVLENVNHPDPEVREAVARALAPPGLADNPPPANVLDAVFALIEDTNADVRSWATFALAHFDIDTAELRDALFVRLSDTGDHGRIAAEALRGLARRHDLRALEPTIRWLEMRDRPPGDFILAILAAAQTLADGRCLPALYALRDEWAEDPNAFRDARDESRRTSGLAAAIRECERGAPAW